MHTARIESAERTGVVVDLRDAEVARLELLNEALDPVFDEIPAEVELFDRGISRGETPRLWIDPIAHVAMGRDKRVYRFVQDTRYGRKVLAESVNVAEMVDAVTHYVAQPPDRARARAGGRHDRPSWAICGRDAQGATAAARRWRAIRALRCSGCCVGLCRTLFGCR